MATLSTSFINIGSANSSVRDAIQSYRRAQYLVAGSTVFSTSYVSDLDEDNDEHQHGSSRIQDGDYDAMDEDVHDAIPRTQQDEHFISQLDWDEEYGPPVRQVRREQTARTVQRISHDGRERQAPQIVYAQDVPKEDTPLISKAVSFSTLQPTSGHAASSSQSSAVKDPTLAFDLPSHPSRRRLSSTSVASARGIRHHGGQSTFGQTLFNSIAILLGIGMLTEPLALACSGWAVGTFLNISYGFISCYTAKILARIILSDPRIRSYSDIGRRAFGARATPFISIMFCLELFAVSVILVTLYGDSLHSLIPRYSSNTYKAWGILLFIPPVFLPLSLLSYTSILGIISTVLVVAVILIDGFSKKDAPGSLWSPAETNIGVQTFSGLGVAFGLFMAGFSGHAVIPSLARDMVDPTQFDTMINWAFLVATCIYGAIGSAGYLMFGNNVSDQIGLDLLATPGYNEFLNRVCLWMLVVSPLSKFALNTQPLNVTLEILLGIDTPISSPEDLVDKPDGLSIAPAGSHFGWKRVLAVLQRIFLTCLAVAVSIMVPEFSSMMAFLGSFSAFLLSIVGPVMAKVMIQGRCCVFDGVIVAVALVMALWGTLAAFW